MQVNFLKPVTIGFATYGVGIHDVPTEDTKNNWFFDALVADGSAVVLRSEEGEPEQKGDPEPEPEPEPELEPEPDAPTKPKPNK